LPGKPAHREEAHNRNPVQKIHPGMTVRDTRGSLGQKDISLPKVKAVRRNRQGDVETIIVEKGTFFRKDLEIPADRILDVEEQRMQGQVTVDVREEELEALTAHKPQKLASEQQAEREARQRREQEQEEQQSGALVMWLRQLGPGLLGGLSGNDSSAVTAYAIDGAQAGFGHLWLMLLSTPMYQSVLYACAKIGRVTQQGFDDVVRAHYGRAWAVAVAVVLVVANVALIGADLVAIGSGFMLLFGINWVWFVVPVAALLWYLVTYTNFGLIKTIFMVMSLAFVTYIITAILARPNWGTILLATVIPHLDLRFNTISSAVALLGATISPYTMFWQVQGETEEERPGSLKRQTRFMGWDIASGAISGNLVAYFIIVSTAATLFTHHKQISTAADAASALVPLLGPFAKYLFAIGLIGAGAVAIPILLASTAYAITGTIGWPAGLSKLPWENEGFYLILTGALLVSLVLALMGLDPIRLIFWANILNGFLAPVLVAFIFLMANKRAIMDRHRVGLLTNFWLVLTIVVLVAAAVLLIYGLLTGQSG
jgi:Mn2+/Fe2+ NRAMP family transporter